MNAGFMGEGIRADNRLVRLHREAGDAGNHFRGADDLRGVDPRVAAEHVLAGAHRHHDFFQRGIARPLAQAVDRAFDLTRAGLDGGQGVGHGEAEIVMTMHRPHDLIRIGYALDQLGDAFGKLAGQVVADGVRNIDHRGAFLDHRLNDAAEEVQLGTSGVLAGKLHIVDAVAGKAHRPPGRVDDLVGSHAQLLFHVDRAGRDEGVDAPGTRRLDRLEGTRDVLVEGPAQPRHGGILDDFGNRLDRFEIAVGGRRKTGLDHVHTHFFQLAGDAQLLLAGHRCARALLAVAQGGIEYDQVVLSHGALRSIRKNYRRRDFGRMPSREAKAIT